MNRFTNPNSLTDIQSYQSDLQHFNHHKHVKHIMVPLKHAQSPVANSTIPINNAMTDTTNARTPIGLMSPPTISTISKMMVTIAKNIIKPPQRHWRRDLLDKLSSPMVDLRPDDGDDEELTVNSTEPFGDVAMYVIL